MSVKTARGGKGPGHTLVVTAANASCVQARRKSLVTISPVEQEDELPLACHKLSNTHFVHPAGANRETDYHRESGCRPRATYPRAGNFSC